MKEEHSKILTRMIVAFGLVLLLPVTILLQMLRINIGYGKNLRELWRAQALDFITIPAQRGNILDDKGRVLVTDTVSYNLAIDPLAPKMTHSDVINTCDVLSKFTHHKSRYYLSKINNAFKGSRYIVLDRGLSPSAYDSLRELDYTGIILNSRYKRRYNYDSLAAQVLGYVNHNLDGVNGLEKYYNNILKGEDGIQQVQRDKKGDIIAIVGAPRKKPHNGYSIETTLNLQIQAIVEEELRDGIKRTRADYGTAIVMDPKTGAIKAMASYPTFNPNHPGMSKNENMKNYAISNIYEPGSTFKIVYATAAVDQGIINFKEKFVTPKDGKQLIHGRWMRDDKPLGTMTFPQIIARSSNIGSADIAMKIPPDVYYQYARNYGFGSVTGIDLPNEEPGVVHKPYTWTSITEPWMAIGYSVQVTPLQLAQAYSALANGGILMRPYVVKKILNSKGQTVKVIKPVAIRRVAKKQTIEKLLPVFHGVVSDSGTAYKAQIKGLRIVGKTGTAQTYINGRYRMEYHATFVGFFPEYHPKYLCLVMLDHPRSNIYGGQTSAPIFRDIAERIIDIDDNLQQYIERHNYSPKYAVVPNAKGLTKKQAEKLLSAQGFSCNFKGEGNIVTAQFPAEAAQVEPDTVVTLTLNSIDENQNSSGIAMGVIPEVQGLSMRKATYLLMKAGFKVHIIGSGTVFRQFPKAKAHMQTGHTVLLRGEERPMSNIVASISN